MIFSISNLSVVPVRSAKDEKSEVITQLLFGEMVETWEKKGNWTKVRCTWDNQIGWVLNNQLTPLTNEEVNKYQESFACSLELAQPAIARDHFLPVTMGATLPCFDGMGFEVAGLRYAFSGQVITPLTIKPTTELLLKLARRYLYAPYFCGGRSPFGIDSTGLIQVLFKMLGINLPRDAYLQARKGELIDFFEQSTIGDLVFFEDKNGHIHHVGIIFEPDKILHAYGQVRIDKIDHFGIFNQTLQQYTHKLRVIKRVLPPDSDHPVQEEKTDQEVTNQIELFRKT